MLKWNMVIGREGRNLVEKEFDIDYFRPVISNCFRQDLAPLHKDLKLSIASHHKTEELD